MGEPYSKKEWETILAKAKERDHWRVTVLYEIYATSDMSSRELMDLIKKIADGEDVPI